MNAYDHGRKDGLKEAAKIARRWHSDETTRQRWENRPPGVRDRKDQDVIGRAAEREYRQLVTGLQLAAMGIAQEIEALCKSVNK